MSGKERGNKENKNSSADFGFVKINQMMHKMKDVCCSGKGSDFDCFNMMENIMKQMKNQYYNNPPRTAKETRENMK